MRLLAEEATVMSAHSNSSQEERRTAFSMFSGHSVQEGEWSPRKRILSNVDILSEGISINELDTVVISDDRC